nr:T9SS type A sorting domain-containing protein [uncultured Draconibacterium sp.]
MKKHYVKQMIMSSYSLSVLEKWLFRCWCNAIFVLLLVIIMALNSYGQIVTEGATVKVNFGIDADIYANDLTVFESPFTYDTDDWFINLDSFPGDGLGVIDQTTAASLLTAVQANYNTSFELRMSSTPSRNWLDPSTGLLWIDAVYFRDWNSQGNFNDESVFTSGQDKNGADPSTWSLGTGGTPQKNDLVDVMGHMRQDTNGDVYGIGAFTTISSDGNSHADFEFFQNQIDFVGGALTNLGPDAGHTAWEFDADNVTQVGDLIVSIDFENGGTNPQASVRLWMSDATFATLSGAIPTNVDFTLTGEFDSGEGADGYGYAEIEATGAFAVAWAIVNVNEAVLGAPWGSLEAKTWYENIQELQYAEFAINLTAIGIGDFGGADPCNKTLGSLMVKTRSSSSFTAELKDFAGPFLFGIELTTDVAVHDSEECQDEVSYNIDLTANVDTTFGNIITYHNSYDDATQYLGVITDSTSHNIPLNEMPKTIYVRASNPQDIECFVVDSFTIGFYPNPVCDITSYDASNIYTYDGAAKVNTPDIVSYNWYTTDGLIGGGATTDSIWGLKGSLDGIDYYVDLEDSNGCTVTCTTTVYAGTYTPPDCTVEVVDATCDGYNNGSAKLQDVPPNWADYDYAWYKLPDEITVIGTDTMITSLDSGTYKLVITDNNLDVPQSTECEGTVSDRDPVTLTCPGDYLEITCTDPVDIKTHFDNWLAGVSVIGSDSMLTTDWDSVTYPNACGDTITVTWTLHDECAIPNTCSATFRVPADLTDPVLANLPTGGDLGCNPIAPTCDDGVTASDNCDGDISADVVCTPMAITGDDCNKAQTFMYTVEDECDNADTAYVNYTWKVDLTDPVLANLPTGGDLGCNPTAPTCDDNVTASDNCDGDISADVVCTPMAITGDDCNKAQTFMYTVEDECGNADTAYVNYTWKVDLTDPVLANLPTGGDLGCNPTAPTCDDNVTASDNCDGDISADVVCSPMAITGDDCNKAQTFMYTVEDECGNADTAYVNYTWKVDLTDPVLANLPTGGDLGCNPTAPTCDDNVTASDNCDGDISADVVCSPMAITGDDCNKAQTFMYTVEDECGNADTAYVNYTWKVDLTDPVLANLPTGGDLGCNPTAPTCEDNVTASDNCDGDISADVVCTPMAITGDDCNKAQTFMYTVEDECGNADTAYVSYTWKEDSEAPVVDSIPFMDSICNMEPEAMIWAYWTDNCEGSDSSSATPVWVEGTCPEVYGYSFHIEDECRNPTDTTVYVKKWMEQTGNCETVFGRLPEDADTEVICFLDEGLFDRWGWTNQITMQDTTYVMDLYAGAAHCDTENRTPVGTVEVRWEGDSVVVDYMMNAGNYLEEVHVYVGYEKYPVMGNGKKQKQTVAPGQYTVVVEDEGYYTGAHVVISNVVDPFWIIAHGVACELTCVCYGEVDVNPDGVFILNGSNSIVDANDYPWWEEMDAEDLPPFNGSKRADASLERKKGQKSGNLLLDIEPTLQESELNVFPNPFDEVVNFEFVPAVSGHAVLEIHNMLGQRVVRLLNRPVEAGELQRVEFRPNSEISGVYLYRLDIDGNTQIGKIIYRNR